MKGGLWKRSIAVYGSSARGTSREVSFTRTLKNMYSKALETGVFLNTDPAGDHGKDASFPGL